MVGLVGAHVDQQLYSLNIDNPTDCAQKFVSNHQVGASLFAGIVLGTYLKKSKDKKKSVAAATTTSTQHSTASTARLMVQLG